MVTSPEPRGERLRALIESRGMAAVCVPMIRIEPLEPEPGSLASTWLADTDLVIFVSPNAVRFGSAWVADRAPGARLGAVGEATAAALGSSIRAPEIAVDAASASEGLARAIMAADHEPARICIVRGEGGRELLARELARGGALVYYLECYRRLAPDLSPRRLSELWNTHRFDTVILTSVDAAKHLLELDPGDGQLASARYLAASARIARYVMEQLGPGCRVRAADSALDEDLVDALSDMR